MSLTNRATGHHPVEPDQGPVPTPTEEPGGNELPHPTRHAPEVPGVGDAA